MILIVIGTNRRHAVTRKIGRQIERMAGEIFDEEIRLLDLTNVHFELGPEQYDEDLMSEELKSIQDELIVPARRFIFIFPEYNGSYPGILKLFIDALSIRKYKASFEGKRAISIGVATGRAGNLRGLDQFDQVLQHLGVHTYNRKLPLSQISRYMEDDEIVDTATLKEIRSTLTSYAEF